MYMVLFFLHNVAALTGRNCRKSLTGAAKALQSSLPMPLQRKFYTARVCAHEKVRNQRLFCGRMVGLGGGEKRRRKKVEKIEGRRLEKPLGAVAEFNFFFFFFFLTFACVEVRRDSKIHANGHKSQRGGPNRLVGG